MYGSHDNYNGDARDWEDSSGGTIGYWPGRQSGTWTSIRVPPDGRESMAIAPPTRRNLSRMLTSPSPSLLSDVPQSNPAPSSTIRSETPPSSPLNSTRA